MSKHSIEVVWKRICNLEDKTVYTKRGYDDKKNPRTYRVIGDKLCFFNDQRDFQSLRKSKIQQALESDPVIPEKCSSGDKSYIWTILHDKRIRLDDW